MRCATSSRRGRAPAWGSGPSRRLERRAVAARPEDERVAVRVHPATLLVEREPRVIAPEHRRHGLRERQAERRQRGELRTGGGVCEHDRFVAPREPVTRTGCPSFSQVRAAAATFTAPAAVLAGDSTDADAVSRVSRRPSRC